MPSIIPCIKCNISKPLDLFYKSTIYKSGHGECKTCVRSRVAAANKKPHRVAYFNSQLYRDRHKSRFQSYLNKYPARHAVRIQTNKAIEKGLLTRASHCESCNATGKIEAHHDDYNKMLDVRWLCIPCHKDWHNHHTPIYQSH